MINDKVLAILREAVKHDGEIRLVKEGKHEGLLPGRAKAVLPLIEACLDSETGFFIVVREEITGKAKKKTHWFVKLTDKGLTALIESSDVSDYADLAKEAAACYQGVISKACTPALQKAQQDIFQAACDQWQEAVDMATNRLNFLEDQGKKIAEAVGQTQEFLHRMQIMPPELPEPPEISEPEAEVPETGNTEVPVKPKPTVEEKHLKVGKLRPPTDLDQAESAYEYQRSLCEGLIQAWEDATHPDSLEELEYCLLNAGLEPANAVGEIVRFNGIDHETEDDVSEGDAVEIVRPAWCLPLEQFGKNEKGEVYQLCKAVVRATNSQAPAPPLAASSEEL